MTFLVICGVFLVLYLFKCLYRSYYRGILEGKDTSSRFHCTGREVAYQAAKYCEVKSDITYQYDFTISASNDFFFGASTYTEERKDKFFGSYDYSADKIYLPSWANDGKTVYAAVAACMIVFMSKHCAADVNWSNYVMMQKSCEEANGFLRTIMDEKQYQEAAWYVNAMLKYVKSKKMYCNIILS